MLPKLRRVSGIEKGLEFIPPADRRHDAYFDLHLRRRKSSLEKETSRALTTTNSRMKQDHIFSSAHSQKQNNEEQDDTPRDIGLARRLQAEIAAIEPASVSIQPEPLTETQITEARAQLPWRQPPNPIPRWMVEQHIGKDAAKVALRRSDAAIKKKNHNSTTDHRPPSSFGTRDRRRLENYHNTSAPLSSTKTKRNTKKNFATTINSINKQQTSSTPPLPMPTSIIDALDTIVRYQRKHDSSAAAGGLDVTAPTRQQQRRTSLAAATTNASL